MSEKSLIVGMPAGSLADPKRGGSLAQLLKQAGFPTKGYDQGGPTTFPINPFFVGWDGRPQEFGSQLALGDLDIAIAGDDWIRERRMEMHYEFDQEIELTRVLSLDRGKVRVVIINSDEAQRPCDEWLGELLAAKKLVTMVSEMPYLALEWFRKRIDALGFAESHQGYSVQKFQTPPRIDSGIVIYETWGKTEAKVKNGAVDFGLEITQSGSAIRNYGLYIADVIMHSQTSVWANPSLKEDPEKRELARMLLLNLYGAVFAEHKILLTFNSRNEDMAKILEYLTRHNLFANEPTMSEGVNFVVFSIQLDTNSTDLTLARVRYELAKLGATGIETVPLESSIPGYDVIDF